jgi:hypothetical protein
MRSGVLWSEDEEQKEEDCRACYRPPFLPSTHQKSKKKRHTAPKVAIKKPICRPGEHLKRKEIQGRQGSQPSAARKTEKNSRNRQQGRNSSWKVFSGSSFFLGQEELLPRRLPAPSDSPWSGQDPISAFFPGLHSFMIGNRHHPQVRPSICLKMLTRSFTSICVKMLTNVFYIHLCEIASRTSWPRKKNLDLLNLL